MKFERLLNQASERIPSYRRVVFKTFVISLASGAKTSGIFRSFADILSIAGVSRRKLYNFLNSAKIPWKALVDFLVASIAPYVVRDGRIFVALDDTTYAKFGKQVSGCATHFDHAAKQNSYVFSKARRGRN
ncbi:MAG: transposase [Victivallales bacterium]|nr:transposase [Victivallales bacterium]